MPTDKTPNDNDISALLHKSDPPQSPRELDERIVQHARHKAEEYQENSSSVGFRWIGDSWKTVVAVFSVSVIAVSVTIQVYNGSRTVDFSTSSVESLPLESGVREEEARDLELRDEEVILQSPASIQAEPQAITDIATATGNAGAVSIAVEARAQSPTVASAELTEVASRSQSADAADSLIGTATQGVALANTVETPNAQAVQPDSDSPQSRTELLSLVETDAVARSAENALRERELTVQEPDLNELVSVLADILIAAAESEPARQSLADTNASSDIDLLTERVINVYRSNQDETELAQLESLYQQEKQRFTDRSFPETLLDVIELLEAQTPAQ